MLADKEWAAFSKDLKDILDQLDSRQITLEEAHADICNVFKAYQKYEK